MPLAEYLSWATAKVSASAIISSEGLTEGETASKHTGQDSVVSAHLTSTPSPSCWQNASLDSGAFSSLYRAVHDIVVGCLQSERAPPGGSGRKSSLCNLILEGHPTLSVVLPSPR